MELDSPESGPSEHELSEGEMAGLFAVMGGLLVRKGTHDHAWGAYTPPNRPEALQFLLPIEPAVIKELFYPGDDKVEIVSEDTYLSYITPHSLEEDVEEASESSICLNIRGKFTGTLTFFSVGYLFTRLDEKIPRDANPARKFTGDVQVEYFQDERVIGEEVIEVAGDIIAFSPHYRDMTLEDGDRIRRLVDILS